MIHAVGYMRTSSAANVGEGKDSEPRQRAAIEAYAAEAGYVIAPEDFFYDPKIKGADAVTSRPGFAAMLERIAGNGVRTIIVESPDRFARDLTVQLTGHDYLKKLGIALIPASAPDYFIEDTPTAVLVRQVLGAIAQFEKACTVAKLRAARDRIRERTGRKVGGRRSYAEMRPEVVEAARDLRPGRSFRAISAELAAAGHVTPSGRPYAAMAVRSMFAAREICLPPPEKSNIGRS